MKYYIGVDLGTSAVKLLLMDQEGQVVNIVSREYPLSFPHPGWSEQNPEDWWEQSKEGIKELISKIDATEVAGISFGGQMHGLVILDENDQVIRPAILWNDGRTTKETDYLNQVIGKEKLSEYTANIAFAGFTAPKILWVKENEPENFAKICKIMLPKDYLAYCLTGVHCCDYSDASGMLLLDVKNKCWSEQMLEICGVSREQMPELFESYEKVGTLKPEVAKELGMKEVLIPPHPGTLCSLGLLLADTKFDLSRTKIMNGEAGNLDDINEQFDNMVEQGTGLLDKEGVPADRRYFEFAVDMRYQRQNFEISIPVPAGKMTEETLKKALADFHAEHKRSYGYCKEDAIVQFVSYRVSAIGVIDKPDLKAAELHPEAPIPEPIEVRQVLFQNSDEYVETPVYLRDKFVPGQSIPGPCICEQMDTTLVVPKGWVIHVDGYHNLKIHDEEAK